MPPPVSGLVSVIIPAFNHERYVGRAIESVLGQSYENYEIVVVDDGSQDKTSQVVEQYIPRGVTLLRQENAGTAATLNRCLRNAKGEYISILNSDDAYWPTRLERLTEHLQQNPDCLLCFTRARMVNADDTPTGPGPQTDWMRQAYDYHLSGHSLAASLLHKNLSMTTSNYFFRAALTESIGGFVDLRYVNDLNFLFRAMERGQVDFLDEVLLDYRRHDSNTIDESWGECKNEFDAEMAWLLADLMQRNRVLQQMQPNELVQVLERDHGCRARLIVLLSALMARNPERSAKELLQDQAVKNTCSISTLSAHNKKSGQGDYRRLYEEVVCSRKFRFVDALHGLSKRRDLRGNLIRIVRLFKE